MEMIIENLRRYYEVQDTEYNVEEFAAWCEEREFDDNNIEDELEVELEENGLVDFYEDGNFPYASGTTDDENVRKAIMLKILRECAKEKPNFDTYSAAMPQCMLIYYFTLRKVWQVLYKIYL